MNRHVHFVDLENQNLLGSYHSAGAHENEGKLQRVISSLKRQRKRIGFEKCFSKVMNY